MVSDVTVVERPEVAWAALSPLRRQLLGLLDEPASATELATKLGMARQRINYHLSVLERQGLIQLAEVRQRRGFQERRFRRTGTFVLAPDLLGGVRAEDTAPDDMSAEAVVAAATDAIRAVGALAASGRPHPTATMSTEVAFASPADLRRFFERVAELAAEFDQPRNPAAVRMQVTLLSHEALGERVRYE